VAANSAYGLTICTIHGAPVTAIGAPLCVSYVLCVLYDQVNANIGGIAPYA
jgi:hypothetical protein